MKTLAVSVCAALTLGWMVLPVHAAPDRWSPPSGELVGRLLVQKAKITTSQSFLVTLELKNTAKRPVTVETNNPFAARFEVLDGKGAVVGPARVRRLDGGQPRWKVVASRASVRFVVAAGGRDEILQLDAGAYAWKLSRGAYQLRASFGFGPRRWEERRGGVVVWRGKLALPPIPVEVE